MKILYASDVLLMICQMQVQYEWKLYVYPKFKTVFSSCNGKPIFLLCDFDKLFFGHTWRLHEWNCWRIFGNWSKTGLNTEIFPIMFQKFCDIFCQNNNFLLCLLMSCLVVRKYDKRRLNFRTEDFLRVFCISFFSNKPDVLKNGIVK